MYKYFVPDSDATASAPMNSLGDIVPLYNEQGEFVLIFWTTIPTVEFNIGEITGYIRKPTKGPGGSEFDKSIKQKSSGKTI
jgi:hypothetical protein